MTELDSNQVPPRLRGDSPQYPYPPSRLEASVYTDPDRYERELREIFFRTWLPVCPVDDLPNPRDVVVWDQLDQSIVIARTDDDRIVAWHNVCQHRGARLVAESGPCRIGRVKCPWHGFVYELDGRVESVPLRATFDPEEIKDLRAPAVRAEQWGGLVWLCFDDSAPTLADYLGELATELGGYGLDAYTLSHRHSATLKANWKLVVDAFNETWHVPFTHRETLSALVQWRRAHLYVIPPHSWMTLPVKGLPTGDDVDHRQGNICHYLAFPSTIFSCFPNHLQMWTAWPVDVNTSALEVYQLVGSTPAGMTDAKWERAAERNWSSFMDVLAEDVEVINSIDTVVRSRGYTRNIFNSAETRLTAFHEEVAKRVD
jgi:phenylpropionate dioxygenase-like ring-hydroxylating dioxygenase large terminal subunit